MIGGRIGYLRGGYKQIIRYAIFPVAVRFCNSGSSMSAP